MNRILNITTAFVVATVCGFLADSASANDYRHINRLATKIHNRARSLQHETNHYRLTPQYSHIVGDVAQLDQLACHMRDTARNEGDLDHLAADVAQLDEVFHHISDLFDQTELDAARGCSRIKGNTRHVKRLLEDIEEYIHHIGEDVDVLRAALVPVVVQRPVYSPPVIERVETYRVPSNILHSRCPYRPYGGVGVERGRDHDDHDQRNRVYRTAPGPIGAPGHGASYRYRGGNDFSSQARAFSIGGGSTRISFGF